MQYKFKNLDTKDAKLLTRFLNSRFLDDFPRASGKQSAFYVGLMRCERCPSCMKIPADISRCYCRTYTRDPKIISTNDNLSYSIFFLITIIHIIFSIIHVYQPFQPNLIRVYHLPARAVRRHVAFPFSNQHERKKQNFQ